MFTDMVGSTAAAQANESEALKLRDEQAALVRPLFSVHQGREIKSMGDGFLAEFDSALRAVQCAIDIQQHLHERNSQPGTARIQLRIGVHLGDVEQRATDIFGDAVNIASRIEPLATPGGVCISGEVFSQVRNKIPNRLEKLEPMTLKNVLFPMEVYRVVLPWTVAEASAASPTPTGLAVLPFANISPDPKDEYFADGLTEELITALSQLRELRVIARTSVTPYKSTSKGVAQIGAELRVTSILEGSVRKAGNRLRVTAQLIDVGSEGHVWAKTYDRELDDIFAVQSELAKQVAETLKIELHAPEAARLEARPPVQSDSYDAYLKGRAALQDITQPSLEAAKHQFEIAISLDPRNASAHSGLAAVTCMIGWWHTDLHDTKWVETSRRLAARAIELDPTIAEAHSALAQTLWPARDYAAMEREFKLALALNPSDSLAREFYAGILQDQDRPEEAVREYSLAEEANPLWPLPVVNLANLLIWLGRLDEALVKIRRVSELAPTRSYLPVLLARYHLARSDVEQSLQELRRAEDLESDPRLKRFTHIWNVIVSGDGAQAKELLRREEASPEYGHTPYFLALAYAELGDLDSCFLWLDRQGPTVPLQALRLDPRLVHVRRDPRFEALLKKMNLA